MLQKQADIIEYDFNFTREIDELKKLLGEAENESNRNIKKANDSEHMLKVQISQNIKYFTREIYELKYLLGEAENESNRNITKANVSENKLKFQLSQNIKYLTEISLLKNNVNEITKKIGEERNSSKNMKIIKGQQIVHISTGHIISKFQKWVCDPLNRTVQD